MASKVEHLLASPSLVSEANRVLSSTENRTETIKPRVVGALEPQGLSSNVRKLLTTSLPTTRPRGSWTFDEINLKESGQGRMRRQIPRFDLSAINQDRDRTAAEAASSKMESSHLWSRSSLTPESDYRNRPESWRMPYSPGMGAEGRPHSLLVSVEDESSRATGFSFREFDSRPPTTPRVVRVKKLDLSNLRPSAQQHRTPHPPSAGLSSARTRPQTSRLPSSRLGEEKTPSHSSSSIPRHRLRPFTARDGKFRGS